MAISLERRHAFTWRELRSMLAGRADALVWLRHGEAYYPAPRIVQTSGTYFVPNMLMRSKTLTVADFIGQVYTVVPQEDLDVPARATIWHGIVVGVRHGSDFAVRPSYVGACDVIFEVTDSLPDL